MKTEEIKKTVPQSRVTEIQIAGPGGLRSFLADNTIVSMNDSLMKKLFLHGEQILLLYVFNTEHTEESLFLKDITDSCNDYFNYSV